VDYAAAGSIKVADSAVKGQRCPACSAEKSFSIITSRVVKGQRYRQRQCRECGYKTSELGGQPVADRRGAPGVRSSNSKFTSDQIAEMVALKGTLSLREIGRMFNCSGETVRLIYAGKVCRNLLPAGYRPPPQPSDPSCEQCKLWNGQECRMGFPDPIEEGVEFARDCSLYERA
jgi:Zn ribbon nucleic-acid-binding protein